MGPVADHKVAISGQGLLVRIILPTSSSVSGERIREFSLNPGLNDQWQQPGLPHMSNTLFFNLQHIELNNFFSRWSVNRCKSIPHTVGWDICDQNICLGPFVPMVAEESCSG